MTGIEHCIHFQAVGNEKVEMSVCKISTVSENGRRVVKDVSNIGASCSLVIRRQQLPDSVAILVVVMGPGVDWSMSIAGLVEEGVAQADGH